MSVVSERVATALERLADSNQAIVDMANEERQANYQGGPPYCPHCGRMNPRVTSKGGSGLMADFVLVGICEHCQEVLYGVPEGWQVFRSQEELKEAAK
jgi:transposase-like protein